MKSVLSRTAWLLGLIVLELVLILFLLFLPGFGDLPKVYIAIPAALAIIKTIFLISDSRTESKNLNELINKLHTLNETYLGSSKSSDQENGDIVKTLEKKLSVFAKYINEEEILKNEGKEKTGLLYSNLNSLKEKVRESNEKDKHTIWASEGHATVSEILRSNG